MSIQLRNWTDELIKEFIKSSKYVIYPITDKERRLLKIEQWRIKILFKEAYNRYKLKQKNNSLPTGCARAWSHDENTGE